MPNRVLLQQHLTACTACSETLAVEYTGSHGRLSDTAVKVHAFQCPLCMQRNVIFVPLSAGPFRVKVVLGAGVPGRSPRSPSPIRPIPMPAAVPNPRGPGCDAEQQTHPRATWTVSPDGTQRQWPWILDRSCQYLARLIGRQA